MPVFQDLDYVRQSMPLGPEQDQEVEEQVGTFVQKEPLVVIFGLNDRFHSFLPHLLGNFVQALPKEGGHVTVRVLQIVSSAFDDFLQGGQKAIGLGVVLPPAAVRALVAGGTFWMYADQKGIAVTIHLEVPKFQEVATFLPFGP